MSNDTKIIKQTLVETISFVIRSDRAECEAFIIDALRAMSQQEVTELENHYLGEQ